MPYSSQANACLLTHSSPTVGPSYRRGLLPRHNLFFGLGQCCFCRSRRALISSSKTTRENDCFLKKGRRKKQKNKKAPTAKTQRRRATRKKRQRQRREGQQNSNNQHHHQGSRSDQRPTSSARLIKQYEVQQYRYRHRCQTCHVAAWVAAP